MGGDPGDLVEARHERGAAGAHGRVEGRKVDLAHRPIGHIGDVVVTTAFGGAVAREVLRCSRNRITRPQARALKTAYSRRRHEAPEVWVLTGALHDSPPAWIARDVDHRRKGPVHAICRCL